MATIKTRFIALLTAGALALGAASPAAAASDGQKVVNTILGIAALGAIIHQIDKNKKKSEPKRDTRYDYRYDDRYGHDRHKWKSGKDRDRWERDHRREDHRREARALRVPAACVISVSGRNGRSQAVSEDCLNRSRFEGKLPRACAFDIRTDRGARRTVYGTSCLQGRGVQIGR